MTRQLLQHIALTATTTAMGTALILGNYPTLALNAEDTQSSNKSTAEIVKSDVIRHVDRLADSFQAMATVQAYNWKEQKAIILRVNEIPVLMFLSTLEAEDIHKTLQQAQKVAGRLNQLSAQGFDASQITVEWDSKTEGYSISVKDEELLQINKTTLLPDSTNNLANDALQATNRLRRLLGNAAPLTEVANLPKPQPPVKRTQTVAVSKNRTKGSIGRGNASWYGPGFHGRRTANGERYNQNGLTAAHRTLPFGTKVRVTNLRNNRSVIVRINDRGPYAHGRIIDLSAGAARIIGLFSSGVAPVRVEVMSR